MSNINDFILNIQDDRKEPFSKLVDIIRKSIPNGFEESIGKMINYDVPLSIYPDGYHCSKNTPLPFVSLANQKNFIALYHMGIYSDKNLLEWFQTEYPKHCKYKLNMGKSCIRFKNISDIPYDLIAELMSKISVKQWIATYESAIKKA